MDEAIVDTDVVSYLFKGDTRADRFRAVLQGKTIVVSFMTVAELDRWALVQNWGTPRRIALEKLIDSFLVVPSNRDLCRGWAEIMCDARRCGRVLPVADAWIAATALLFGVPLVTNNLGDFRGIAGLQIFDGSSS